LATVNEYSGVSMSGSITALKGKLIVSCQAREDDPLNDAGTIRRIALSAIRGGAGGLRLNSNEHVAAVRKETTLPIIGLKKVRLNGRLRITPDFASAAELASAGANIIALDCTNRVWSAGEPWREIIERVHQELRLPVMADVATAQEGVFAAAAGADMIGTTLYGYTEETEHVRGFGWELLSELAQKTRRPIVAEGNIIRPDEARRALHIGAWCVVVGSAITWPESIASSFTRAIQQTTAVSCAIAIDIGGTSIKGAIVERSGRLHSESRTPTPTAEGKEAIARAAVDSIDQLLHIARLDGAELAGIGVASAGMMDAKTGAVRAATENLPGWTGFPLLETIRQRFGRSTWLESDGHAAALAELHFGWDRSLETFVVITVGTGLGGGIVVQGNLVRGNEGFAGTFGHSKLRENGRPCNCGKNGCLEAYVSASALVREYREAGGQPAAEAAAGDLSYDASFVRRIGRLATGGDPAATRAYSSLAGHLAEGIARLYNAIDPQAVLLAGGLVEGYPKFIEEVSRLVGGSLHFGNLRSPNIRKASVGYNASLLGAAARVFRSSSEIL
jgi:predicted NBD/HSP70 family sugar kinase/putative N-acetylmannosamine-6-phosphate epimerase